MAAGYHNMNDSYLTSYDVYVKGNSSTIINTGQKSNVSDEELLAKFQSAAKSKISISRDNSPAKHLNMTDDNTNLKMEQNKMVQAQ